MSVHIYDVKGFVLLCCTLLLISFTRLVYRLLLLPVMC